MFLYGRNSVLQRLKQNPKSIKKIFLDEDFDDSSIIAEAKKNKVPINYLSRNQFQRLKRADNLQGIIAEVDKFSYIPFKYLLEKSKQENLCLIFLDSVSDPQNLGAIIRTTACFGGFAICLPKHHSCEITDTVLHVASGGENFVPISMVPNLSNALIEAKKVGYWIIGAVVEGGQDIGRVDLPFPICLVLGSEGEGIRKGLLGQLDLEISLPMVGEKLSFNVAIACAIFCYEITQQR